MKVLMNEVEPQKSIKFPKLMISKDRTVVGLFISPNVGTIIWSEGGFDTVGHTITTGSIYYDFDGEVALSNE